MRATFLIFVLTLTVGAVPIVFTPLAPSICSMAVSEDGRYAFAAHSAEDRVSIWELRTSQLVAELDSPAPHFLLSRGAQLFVLGFRTASVQIFDIPEGKLSKTISVQAHAPTLLSAPRGPYFRGELLVSAGEYNSRRLMLLDSETGSVHRVASSGAAVSVNYAGTNVLIQGEFGNSPRSASLYAYSDLRAPKLEASSRNASSRNRIWHPRPTPYWVDDRSIYNERVERLGEHGILIPDQTSDLIYALRDGKLHAHQLATGFALLGSREVTQPPNPEPQGGGGRIAYQFRPSLAVSTAHGLHLFAYDRQQSTYVHANTTVFIVPPAPRNTPILDAIGTGEKAHRIAEANARAALLAAFDTEFERIAKTGDLDAIDSLQSSQAAFEKDAKLPMTAALYPASAAYQAARKGANIALIKVYSESIIALTKALRIDEARELRDMRDALIAESATIIDHSQLKDGFCELRIGEDIPELFRPSPDALLDSKGLSAGNLRTPQGDYLTRDFVLDVLCFGDASISIGNQFSVQLEEQRASARIASNRHGIDLGRVASEIPHLLRLEKRGRSLLAAWSAEFTGVFVPTGHHLIVDSGESLPELTEKNSFLSIKGRVKALRLAIRGEMITEPKKPTAWPQLHGGWHALGDRGGQPSFMRGHERNLADTNALRGQLRSHTGDYLTRDFIYDAKILGDGQIGLGTDTNSATLRIRSGNVELLQGELRARNITRLYSEGPHVLRLSKTGVALSIGVADTANGPILPLRSIPRLATALPGLNVHNGFLHANGRIAALRLVVDDKPLSPPRRAKVEHPTRMEPHAILNPRAKDVGRFAATDLADRDFVFDLQYRFKPNSKSVLQVGLGHGDKKLLARLHGEGHGNSANLALGGAESLIGKVPGPGPHWIRVSKLGSTLSFAIAVNHGEEFAPFFSRTIPDLLTAAPWCADGLASIIFEGGDELLAAQLSIEGKPASRAHVGNSLRVANSAIAVPTEAVVGTRLKESIVSKGKAKVTLLSGPNGLKLSSRGELGWEPRKAGKFPLTLRIVVGKTTTQLTAEIAVSVTP